MDIIFALSSACGYGASDFFAGMDGRRSQPVAVAALSQPLSLVVALTALMVLPGRPDAASLVWGGVAGLGIGTGTVFLYVGLAGAPMSVVATLSGVITSLLSALVGVALGARLSEGAYAGIGLAVPASALVSTTASREAVSHCSHVGLATGAGAGCGFAAQFIALHRVGAAAGAWPLVIAELVATLLVGAYGSRRGFTAYAWHAALPSAAVAGSLGGLATLGYFLATGYGPLPVVAVLASLYPGVTVVMARVIVGERWSRLQQLGLLGSAASVALICGG